MCEVTQVNKIVEFALPGPWNEYHSVAQIDSKITHAFESSRILFLLHGTFLVIGNNGLKKILKVK